MKVGIVGYGRFGAVLHRLLKDDFEVIVYSKEIPTHVQAHIRVAKNVQELYESDTVFYAVPIESFEKVIASHRKYFEPRHTLIDVLSVKMHPEKIFRKYIKGTGAQAILTHPMFGPDSSKEGFTGLPIILDKCIAETRVYESWKNFFSSKGLHVVEMSAREHDKIAASSQGLTHFVGRLMESYGLKSSSIDSLGTKKLLEIKEQTCNDTWQLFTNLQHYNPFTKKMRIKLGERYDKLYNKLLPKAVDPKHVTFGIQGGMGSFNEKAIRYYIEQAGTENFKIKYLFTSENVLRALHAGEIDRGQFAIHNSLGGTVYESINAMAKYKFKIIDQFSIKIQHALMIRKDVDLREITTVMSHPQTFAQCKVTLAQKYPDLQQKAGTGELIDHAKVAKLLGENKLPKNVAVMGSSTLADLFDLTVVEDNLQDAKENYTSFLHVVRPHSPSPAFKISKDEG